MKDGWQETYLYKACTLDKKTFKGNKLPYVGMEDIESGTGRFIGPRNPTEVKSNTFYFDENHILYGRLRPYLNKVLLPDFEGHCSTEIFPILPNEGVDKRYLFYWLTNTSNMRAINNTCTGARMPRANFKEVMNFKISLPPLEEQKRIVAILDEAFAKIEKAEANAEKNLANARELFDSYMGKLFKEQKTGWPERKFNDICDFVRGPFGGSLKKSCFVEDGIAVYEQQHAINNQFDQVRYFIDDEKFSEMQRFELFPGDLIMSCSGTMGKVAMVPEGARRGIINQALLKLSPSSEIKSDFLKLWMESDDFQDQIKLHSKGVAIKNIASVKVLKEIDVPCPSKEEQSAICNELSTISRETQRLEDIYRLKLKNLADLKQSLLEKAFSGELTAQKADNVIAFPSLSPDELHMGTIAYAYRKHEGTAYSNTYRRKKSEKIIHLIEYQTGLNMGRHAMPMARGPYDQEARERVESKAQAYGYFQSYEVGNSFAIQRLSGFDEIAKKAEAFYGSKKAEVDRIIELLLPMNHQKAEIIATVYTAWNNFLIDGESVDDDKIVRAAREEWHKEKEDIPRTQFINAIRWLEQNSLIPQGQGKRVGDKRLI